jgi:HSP20 family protein
MANLIRRENREVSGRPRPSGVFLDPFRMVDELLRWDPFRSGEMYGAGGMEFMPSFEVKESKEEYVIRGDLPGVKDADLDISVTGNVIQISGRREQESRQEGDRYHTVERSYGQFTRAFSLPDGADTDHVSAELKDGVLAVRIPKKPEVQSRRISIGNQGTGNGGGTESTPKGKA